MHSASQTVKLFLREPLAPTIPLDCAMHQIPILIALVIVARLWWDFVGAKWRARSAARAACQRAGMDFLDELALTHWHINWRHGPRVQRLYEFEFCAEGPERYQGWVQMAGSTITQVQLEPYPIQ
jgi:hypothetical protein